MDFIFTNHGSLWLVTPTNASAREHLESHTGDEAQWFAGALAVETRYVEGLTSVLLDAGFEL